MGSANNGFELLGMRVFYAIDAVDGALNPEAHQNVGKSCGRATGICWPLAFADRCREQPIAPVPLESSLRFSIRLMSPPPRGKVHMATDIAH